MCCAGFQRAVVLQVGGDAGRPEGMVPDPGLDAGVARPPLDHAVGVLLPQGLADERAGLAGRRRNKGASGSPAMPAAVYSSRYSSRLWWQGTSCSVAASNGAGHLKLYHNPPILRMWADCILNLVWSFFARARIRMAGGATFRARDRGSNPPLTPCWPCMEPGRIWR